MFGKKTQKLTIQMLTIVRYKHIHKYQYFVGLRGSNPLIGGDQSLAQNQKYLTLVSWS